MAITNSTQFMKGGPPEEPVLFMADDAENRRAMEVLGKAAEAVGTGNAFVFRVTCEKFRIAVLMVLIATPNMENCRIAYVDVDEVNGDFLAIMSPKFSDFPTAENMLDSDILDLSGFMH